jgi:competence protein ComEC
METVKPTLAESFWRAPLVPGALAVTAGIVTDRLWQVPIAFSLGMGAACLVAWGIAHLGRNKGLGLVYLALAAFAVGAAWHHYRRDIFPADDIGNRVPDDPKKNDVRVRGVLDEEPSYRPPPVDRSLYGKEKVGHTQAVLQTSAIRQDAAWEETTGRLLVVIEGELEGLHCGDEVEIVGRLFRAKEATNPGTSGFGDFCRDQGIRAELLVRSPPDKGNNAQSPRQNPPKDVIRLARNWPYSLSGWLGSLRTWGQRNLSKAIKVVAHRDSGSDPDQHQALSGLDALAAALVLGEGAPVARESWEKYKLTGVIHVIVVSGQHLVILSAFLWWCLRRLGVRQRYSAGVVAVVLFLYVLVTGGRPPGMRSALTVGAVCVALILRRRIVPANLLALAWLAVAFLNPMDLFSPGCQLSFLSVIVLYRFAILWETRKRDELQQIIDEHRPAWLRWLRWLGWGVVEAYLVSLVVWIAVTPLVVWHYKIVPWCGILLGPPLTLLTTIALLTGFVLLLLAAFQLPVVSVAAWVIYWSMALCEWLVDLALRVPGAYVYSGSIPLWWVVAFYLGLLLWLSHSRLLRYWRRALVAGLGWLCVGLLAGLVRFPADELRCTFLAVGHGGCTVLETPDGRTILYDAGAISGPLVTERVIAPYLWHRGIRRIDEVILSHGDLDHFNGLPALLDRFGVAQITCTPTFADRNTRGVAVTLERLRRRKVPLRIVKAGDRLTAGAVTLEVLHPPSSGPEGKENERSLVLCVEYAGQSILLTGDLEGAGLAQVVKQQRRPIDVLMAPHHGSHTVDAAALVRWASPWAVIASMGPPLSPRAPPAVYREKDRPFFSTEDHGAVTVRIHSTGLVIETFLDRQRLARPASRPPRQSRLPECWPGPCLPVTRRASVAANNYANPRRPFPGSPRTRTSETAAAAMM